MTANYNKYNDAMWAAVTRIAEQHGKTCSGLAIICGLGATAFNKCKRHSKYGQPRWLSSETIAKVLTTTNITATKFAKMVERYIQDTPKDE